MSRLLLAAGLSGMTTYHDFSLTQDAHAIQLTTWRLDPERSTVGFEVPGFWGGLVKVKGRFERYAGTLDLRREPAIELTIEADSVHTGNARRDKHLRSDDFFAVEGNPQVRFLSHSATLDGEQLTVTGTLQAAGASEPVRVVATLVPDGEELEIEATAEVDQRRLGMTFRMLRMVGVPAKLAVRGRLVRSD
jgi:polyisoprenoid-binding protein YceI